MIIRMRVSAPSTICLIRRIVGARDVCKYKTHILKEDKIYMGHCDLGELGVRDELVNRKGPQVASVKIQ